MKVEAPISIGELLDKLSIVEIKISKIEDSEKLNYLNNEFKLLESKALKIKKMDEKKFNEFYKSLLEVNSQLWKIEDDIRECENKELFDEILEKTCINVPSNSGVSSLYRIVVLGLLPSKLSCNFELLSPSINARLCARQFASNN